MFGFEKLQIRRVMIFSWHEGQVKGELIPESCCPFFLLCLSNSVESL